MTQSDDTKKRLAQVAALVGGISGFVGISMACMSLVIHQACFLPFNAGHELEKLKEIWTPGNPLGDFNISAASLLIGGWLICTLAMRYLDSDEKDKAERMPNEIPLKNLSATSPLQCSAGIYPTRT